jgi:hypothetical protein
VPDETDTAAHISVAINAFNNKNKKPILILDYSMEIK